MPELPEVETIVRDLSKSLQGEVFSKTIVHDDFILRQSPKDFTQRLQHQSIVKVTRRGKALIMHLSSKEFLVVQLMMTGQLIFNGIKDRHTRVSFGLKANKKLLYNDQRRFGQLRVVARLDEINHFNILGPEPFAKEFTPVYMGDVFQKTLRPIKNVLLDHTFVAGIGNIYACEILFRAGIDPKRQAKKINLIEARSIHRQIVEVLNEAIVHRGSSLRNYRDGAGQKGQFNERLAVYARENGPCHRCGKIILRIVQSGRSTFYCGHCQK